MIEPVQRRNGYIMDKFVGKRLDGRYEIKEIIGVGGMAVVYKAYDSIEDRIVAIKILKEEYASNEEFQRRFKNESKAIAVLSHPNIVKVFDVSFGDLIQYIVMEYIDGITLKEYIERTGNLSWNDAVNFTLQILRGLQHAHDKGIVHRDVKPQNIMVLADKTIKVTDFGIARFARNESQTITDKAIGSVHYISPEQAKGELTDEKADIYSVGVILYEMLTGTLPFEAESAVSVAIMQLQTEPKLPTHINPLIPLGLEQITMRAMQKDPKNRYKSAAEMLRDLEQFKRDPNTVFQNNYFVDDSPTKHIDNFYYDAGPDKENSESAEEAETSKVPLIPILTGVAVTFVAAIIVLCVIFIPRLLGSTGDEFPCPNYVGMDYEALIAEKNEYDFTFEPEYDYSSEQPRGMIFEQTPAAERKVKRGAVIKVKVSIGEKTVQVPVVSGYDATKAKAMLENEGFKVITVEESSEDIASNLIIRTEPAGGSNMPAGTEIKMFVSTGAPTEYLEIPDVTKCTLEDAKRLIERAGFTVGTVTEVSSAADMKGYVVSQSPSASAKTAGKGTAINLSVGNGVTVYKFTLTVPLPDDYISQYGTVSVWIDNKCVKESSKMDILNSQNTSFDISTEKKLVEVVVKFSHENNQYDNYVTYLIDATTGEINNSYTIMHSYPTNTSSAHDSSTVG